MTILCAPIDINELSIVTTWYDPAQCYDEDGNVIDNINCNGDPGHFADGTPVLESSYGTVAACISDWLGATLIIEGLGVFRCRDTGGSIHVEFDEYYEQYVIHVDILAHETIDQNYWLWSDWSIEWDG